jgi:hypothetical protein
MGKENLVWSLVQLRLVNQQKNSIDWSIERSNYVIHEDLNVHPPIPTCSKQVFGNLLFLAVFGVPNFWGHFEGLNDLFS